MQEMTRLAKTVYSLRYETTIDSKKFAPLRYSDNFYVYATPEAAKACSDKFSKHFSTFNEMYDYLAEKGADGFYRSETFFKHRYRIGVSCWPHDDYYIYEKDFISGDTKLTYYPVALTIKELASKLSADDFIAYCVDRGLSPVKELLV